MEVFQISPCDNAKTNILGQERVLTVYSRQNPNLSSMEVSFHWWDEGTTSLHKHDHYEFFIITAGMTYHELNGKVEILNENTLHLIKPEDIHRFRPLEDCKSTHINFSATIERFDLLCNALGIHRNQLIQDQCPLRFLLNSNEMDFFLHRAEQLNLHMREEKKDLYLIQMTICEMLVHGISLLYKRHPLRQDNRPQWLCLVLRRLHSPDMMACSAADVYKLAGYSPPVVIEQFKKHTGETVSSYLVKLKIDWAIILLNTTDMTILEISQALGYSSVSHFCKLFFYQTGKNPSEFRRISRTKS